MSYLFWSLINLSFAIVITYFLYRLTKLIYSKYGTRAVIIFIIILVSLSNSKANKTVDKLQVWNFKTPNNVCYFQQDYKRILDHNSIFQIELYFISLNDKDRKDERPMKAFSSISGIVGYNCWTPKNITIQTSKDNFEYIVTGEMKWALLNYTIYKEQKTYRGQIKKA